MDEKKNIVVKVKHEVGTLDKLIQIKIAKQYMKNPYAKKFAILPEETLNSIKKIAELIYEGRLYLDGKKVTV